MFCFVLWQIGLYILSNIPRHGLSHEFFHMSSLPEINSFHSPFSPGFPTHSKLNISLFCAHSEIQPREKEGSSFGEQIFTVEKEEAVRHVDLPNISHLILR